MRLKDSLKKFLKIEKIIDREKLIYKTNKYTYDFRKFNTIRTFGEDIYDGKITLEEADKNQSDLIDETENFNDKTRPKSYEKKKKKKKKILLIICLIFSMQEKWFITDLKGKYF